MVQELVYGLHSAAELCLKGLDLGAYSIDVIS